VLSATTVEPVSTPVALDDVGIAHDVRDSPAPPPVTDDGAPPGADEPVDWVDPSDTAASDEVPLAAG
jgi:hypothetical protein